VEQTIRAATDVGGTFTDLVYFKTNPKTKQQEIITAKADTTPPNFEQGVMNVIKKGSLELEEIAFLAHGTTVVINALTERKGVKTALITNEGFRDSIEFLRYGKFRYENQEHAVEILLPDGKITVKNGEREIYAVVTALTVNKDDVIHIHTASGGGYGDPKKRSSEKVLSDIKNGYVNASQAKTIYKT
jgi:N-methylhydantoinase A/oxoprolinase/acetone carboxylase beta subunit